MTLFGLLFVLAGCIQSLYPLYTEADLIFDPALVGAWAEKDGKETWTFTKSGEKEYKLECLDEKGKKSEFVAHLLKVKDRRFLNLYPADPDLTQSDFYKMHLRAVHTFLQVRQIEPTLQMAMLDPNWLEKLLKKNPDAVRHEMDENTVLLTAKPKQLQAFLIKYAKSAKAWGEFSQMTRYAEKLKE